MTTRAERAPTGDSLTTQQNVLTFRPISGPDELSLFCQLPYVLNEELAGDIQAGRRQPGWMWVARRGSRLVARAAWWAPRQDASLLLDVFDLDDDGRDPDRVDVGARLLQTALRKVIPAGAQPSEYSRFVPPDWRDDPAVRRTVEDRMEATRRTGARLLVERLRFEWRRGAPLSEPTGRLTFRPAHDPDELIALMALVLEGTLDAHGREVLQRMSPRQAAVGHYEGELARYESPRDWWRIATLPSGEPVGFVVPARNDYNAILAYLGVVPAHRGQGFINEILAEGTRILASQEVPRIRATTDVGNAPMARAFLRAGYVNFEREINMTWG